jgi:MOSC domain-containing protein YiiM
MKLLAVCLGRPEKLPGKSYKTGINKAGVNAAVMIDRLGLVGDAVCNDKHHGGEDQAILLEGSLTLDWWAEQLGRQLPHGSFGENLVVEGLDNRDIAAGDRFHLGDVVLEASCARIPCNTFAAKMGDPTFVKTYARGGRPGIYCRVLQGGLVTPGQPVRIERHEGERVTIAEMLKTYGKKLPAEEKARYLSAPIGSRLRAMIESRN